uniref:cysteine desulfurase n=1 Tax=Fervidicoccus fontis TaxID=683846 RepID=A0A7J3ZLS8_9CREN
MFDVYEVRKDFPILENTYINGKKLVYFDNAATTHKPKQVVEAVREFYYSRYSNVHRGHHYLSEESSRIYEEAHERIAKLVNARSWDEIVFAFNATTAINYIAPSLAEKIVREGKRKIVLTVMEHHSNMLPWRRVARAFNLTVEYAPVREGGELDLRKMFELIDEQTGIVAVAHASNVTGIINDVREIARYAHKYGAYVVVDGAQSVPHLKVDVRELEVDILAFSGHKMLAPEGTGGFYGRRDLLEELEPWVVGGGMVRSVKLDKVNYEDLPWKFEPGTPDIAGSAGLIKAVEYLERIGIENVHLHEKRLLEALRSRLGDAEWLVTYNRIDPERQTGIFCFNVRGLNPHVVGRLLNDFYGIAVRTGLHCAHPYHTALGAQDGTVRASFYIYNTIEEVVYFTESIEEIAKKYASPKTT